MSEIRTLTEVVSSNIEAMGHDPVSQVMTVKFKGTGAIYDYANVPVSKFDQIMAAPSVGSAFNKLVKSNPVDHPFTALR